MRCKVPGKHHMTVIEDPCTTHVPCLSLLCKSGGKSGPHRSPDCVYICLHTIPTSLVPTGTGSPQMESPYYYGVGGNENV